MMDGWNKSVSQTTGHVRLTLVDDGEIVSAFRLSPADVKLAVRCQEVIDTFDSIADMLPNDATLEDAAKFNDAIEDKICYLLGYDAKQAAFGQISATTIMADGNMFVVHMMEKINELVIPEINKRKLTMAQAVAKHTAKYEK